MDFVRDEFYETVRDAGTTTPRELDPEQSAELRRLVTDKYARGESRGDLYSNLTRFLAVGEPDPYDWIGDFVRDTRVVVFFDRWRIPTMFLFERGEEVASVLPESYYSDIYLTDPDATYLLCHDHEDGFYVTGTAVQWMRERLSREGGRLWASHRELAALQLCGSGTPEGPPWHALGGC